MRKKSILIRKKQVLRMPRRITWKKRRRESQIFMTLLPPRRWQRLTCPMSRRTSDRKAARQRCWTRRVRWTSANRIPWNRQGTQRRRSWRIRPSLRRKWTCIRAWSLQRRRMSRGKAALSRISSNDWKMKMMQ